MFYIYRSFSIAGWIAAAVFFAFLGCYLWIKRPVKEQKGAGFDVLPPKPPGSIINDADDAKHP